MISRIYRALTGKPWITSRSAAAEYGPPPGARYAVQLAAYTDAELISHSETILDEVREREAIKAWLRSGRQQQTDTYWTLLPCCGCPVGVVVDEGHQEGCHRYHTSAASAPKVVAP